MNKNNYTPHPIDTKSVGLPMELQALAEDIAKNVHEVWASGRMKDGWTYGEERNDAEKKHPCLVPYEDLSEEEKEYDRNTSIETMKDSIIANPQGLAEKTTNIERILAFQKTYGLKLAPKKSGNGSN